MRSMTEGGLAGEYGTRGKAPSGASRHLPRNGRRKKEAAARSCAHPRQHPFPIAREVVVVSGFIFLFGDDARQIGLGGIGVR